MVRSARSRLLALAVTAGLLAASTVLGASVGAAGYPTIDGAFSGTGTIAGGSSVALAVTGRGGVPATGVGAVALNVTVSNPTAPSFLTAYPTGEARPNAANLVFSAGQTIPNMVVVQVGASGQVSLFNYAGATDVIVDVLGWFPATTAFSGVTPARLMDTRAGYPTIDGKSAGDGAVGAGASTELTVVGRGGVPATGVGAVALNVSAVGATASSFLTVWPKGPDRPTAANLNYVAGQSVPNMVMAKVGDGGRISLFNFAGSVDLAVDVLGWFPTADSFAGLTPARLMDTRAGYTTIDGAFAGTGAIGASATRELALLGRGGIPSSGVAAVALNVAATNASAASFLTAFPSGAARPTAANLNYVPGQTVPNMVIVKLGTGGNVSLYNFAGSVDVVVDVMGWFPDNGSFTGLTPARLMDSRTTDPPPTSSTVGPTFATTTLPQPVGNVVPGAFCSTPGATGTYNGRVYVCSNTDQAGVPYAGGEHRWRRQ